MGFPGSRALVRLASGALSVAILCAAWLTVGAPLAHAATTATTPVKPTAVYLTHSQPDAHGGVWTHSLTIWKTAYPVSKPDAKGNVYKASPTGNTPYASTGGGGCVSGYATINNWWAYTIGSIQFLYISFGTQDYYDSCANTVTNKYTDPQCNGYQGSTCITWSSGVYHNVYCDISPTFGICNKDWANIETHNTWDGQTRWQYMRTWVDIDGHVNTGQNNVG